MKKLTVAMLIAVMALGLTACSSSTSGEEATTTPETTEATDAAGETAGAEEDTAEAAEETNEDTAALSGTGVITGSTSVEPILMDMVDEFTALNPDVTIEYTGSGSSAGIQDAIDGTNNIGASSRELTEEEAGQLESTVFAHDGIAVIVNPANEAVSDITIEDLLGIYSGQITNWSEVGGDDAEIFIVSREESSGTRSAFEELIGLEDAGGLTGNASVAEGNGPVQASVAENEYAIGYVSFSYIDDTIKPLTVGGVEATPENAKSGEYPLSRPFLFAYNGNQTDAGDAFIEFALSADGQAIVEEHGGIKVTE